MLCANKEGIWVFCFVVVVSLGHVPLLVIPCTIACKAPLPVGFPRQEYLSRLPFPSPGDLPDQGIEPVSPALASGLFTMKPEGKPSFFLPPFQFILL